MRVFSGSTLSGLLEQSPPRPSFSSTGEEFEKVFSTTKEIRPAIAKMEQPQEPAYVVEDLSAKPALGDQAKAALVALMEKEGIPASSVKMSYAEELTVCPGVRAWTNRFLVVEYPGGETTLFDAEWTVRRPDVTLDFLKERLAAATGGVAT